MKKEIREHYEFLVNFLGKTLGPCYEIVLYEVEKNSAKIVSIINNEISNRSLGDSIFDKTLDILKNKEYKDEDAFINYTILLNNGKKLRCSTMFIRENQKIVGILCVNFDDSQFQDINKKLLRIIHPDLFVNNFLSDITFNNLVDKVNTSNNKLDKASSKKSVSSLMEKMFEEVKYELHLPSSRLTKNEREMAVSILYDRGFFNLKDSVPFVAKKLSCSPTTVYRYISK